jgi:hypothetical protein
MPLHLKLAYALVLLDFDAATEYITNGYRVNGIKPTTSALMERRNLWRRFWLDRYNLGIGTRTSNASPP